MAPMPLRINRRRACTALGMALASSSGLRAQAPERAHIGFVSWFTSADPGQLEPLREGLRELGWVEGRNLRLDAQFTGGDLARTREVLTAFVRQPVDLIVARATNAAHAAKEATATIPVVMLVSDPLATGLVRSLARPEANLTGLSLQGPDLAGKRLEYLRALMPAVRRVAFLGAASDPNVANFVRETQAAAAGLGVELQTRLLPRPQAPDEGLFRELAAQGVGALLVQPIYTGHHETIVAQARRHRIAVISNYEVFARAGALLTYGPDDAALTRRAAWFADRLLRGARPGDLPVEQPSRFRLVINRATARALGLSLPPEMLVHADQVIG